MANSKDSEVEDIPVEAIEAIPEDDTDAKPAKPEKAAKPQSRKKSQSATDLKLLYPPSPDDVPEDLTEYPTSYVKQENRLLAGLFLFLVFYIGAVLFFAMIGVWCVWSLSHFFPLKVFGIVMSSLFFLYLVKGFFKGQPIDKNMHIEITAKEHPVLFEFIETLCDELDAPRPNKVFVSPDVNAAVMPQTKLLNLFVEPKKDLLIGLGLVNSVNLSEFKAVLAHEFGHFSQSAMASSYTYVASRIIGDLVDGEDWFDRMIEWCKRQENAFKVIGYMIGGPLWLGRKILQWFYNVITLQRLAVRREREFHADLVAVSAAGSNAVVHCLLRTEFGHQCFVQAVNDMHTAMDHKLYTNDMYLHQTRAAVVLRRKKKEPELGMPPALNSPNDGKRIEVFDAEEESLADDIPPMWRTHPSNSDREKNAKDQFVPAVVDHRSPWLLFGKPDDLKERMTYKFYRMVFKIPKNAELADAKKVQEFIDNEHADTTYDPKYNGIYDDRPLEPVAPDKDGKPGDLNELNVLVTEKPWDDDRIEKVLDKLYDGCREKAEELYELRKERAILDNTPGKKSNKLKKKIDAIDEKLDTLWEWLRSLDRRVYLIHVQMAGAVNPDTKSELIERYRFQLEVQRLYSEARYNQERALAFARLLFSLPNDKVPPELGTEVMSILRQSWRALKKIIQDARDINLPAMKNFEEGENLADFILEGKMVPEPPISYVRLDWCQKLVDQLAAVRSKCFRLHFKSVGGILAIQEKVAAQWRVARAPVAAEIVPDELPALPAEVVSAEVIPAAEVVAAEVVAAEVIPAAEVVTAEVIPAEAIPAEVVAAEVVPTVAVAEVVPEPTPVAPAMIFDFDAPEETPKPQAASLETALPVEALPVETPPVVADQAEKTQAASQPAPTGDLFTLDADELNAKSQPATVPVVAQSPEPTPVVVAKQDSGVVASASARPSGSTVVRPAERVAEVPPSEPDAVVIHKHAEGKRPAIKITLVKPGDKSPFAQ